MLRVDGPGSPALGSSTETPAGYRRRDGGSSSRAPSLAAAHPGAAPPGSRAALSETERVYARDVLTPAAETHRAALERLTAATAPGASDGDELAALEAEYRQLARGLRRASAPSRRVDLIRRALRDAAQHYARAAELRREGSSKWTASGYEAIAEHDRARALARGLL